MTTLTPPQTELLNKLVQFGGRTHQLTVPEKRLGTRLVGLGLCEWRGSKPDVLHITDAGRSALEPNGRRLV